MTATAADFVVIHASAPGLSPRDVEQTVTTALERVIADIPGVLDWRSASAYASCTVELRVDAGAVARLLEETRVRASITLASVGVQCPTVSHTYTPRLFPPPSP